MKITEAKKLALAAGFVLGTPIRTLCETHGISEAAFFRLRREDELYQQHEHALLDDLRVHLSHRLHQHVDQALTVLADLLTLDVQNFVEGEGPNGGKVVTRRIDPKLVSEKRLTADCLLSHWQRRIEHEQAQENWVRLNLGSSSDDEDDDDDEYDDTEAA